MKQEHPLTNDAGWEFHQPEIGYVTNYAVVDLETKHRSSKTIRTSNTCREGIIHNTRTALQMALTSVNAQPGTAAWGAAKNITLTGEMDLTPGQKKTELGLFWYVNNPSLASHGSDAEAIANFLRICDTVLGPVCVLLGTKRPEGTWWKTDPTKALRSWGSRQSKAVYWKGTDNWFLVHPAAMSIALGLYRQCFLLCRTKSWKSILRLVSGEEVEEVMSLGSQALALRILKRTRPFIEVPVGPNGGTYNYPFALGFWKRLLCLQRAIRRHGYEKSFDQSFVDGWNLLRSSSNLTGAYSHWGNESLTEAHQKLLKLGAVRLRRKSSGSKQATASARKRRR